MVLKAVSPQHMKQGVFYGENTYLYVGNPNYNSRATILSLCSISVQVCIRVAPQLCMLDYVVPSWENSLSRIKRCLGKRSVIGHALRFKSLFPDHPGHSYLPFFFFCIRSSTDCPKIVILLPLPLQHFLLYLLPTAIINYIFKK